MPHPLETFKNLFRFSPSQLEAVEHLLVERHFCRGSIIDGQHSLQTQIFYLKKGAARVFYIDNGHEHTVQFAFDDEYLHTHSNIPVQASVMFMEESDVIYLPMSGMRDLLSEKDVTPTQEAILYMNASLIDHVKNLEERIYYTQNASAVDRYKWIVNRYPRLLECATVTQIASYLGLTKETLYRIRSGKY